MEEFEERAKATIPLGRGGQPEDIVGAALPSKQSDGSLPYGTANTALFLDLTKKAL